MEPREFKQLVFQEFARIGAAFANSKRLEIIDILAQAERDVDTLSRRVGLSVASTSQHLQVLKQAKLVKTRREGVKIYYRLADEQVAQCWLNLQHLAESRSSEIREAVSLFYRERDSYEPLSAQEVWQKIEKDEVILIDVRPREEYLAAHLPGAISVPLPELENFIREAPAGKEIVAYCRGKYCVLSAEAVKRMTDASLKAIRLSDGLPDWKFNHLPIEVKEEK